MNRTWQRLHWESRLVRLEDEAGIAIELWAMAIDGGACSRRGRVTYWDAEGQLFLDMVNDEIPVVVLEEAIAEAKVAASLERPRRRRP